MATYYVDGINGSDTNSGTEGSPFLSITRALMNADVDQVIVEPAIYTETVTTQQNYPFPEDGDIGNPGGTDLINIVARGTCIIDGESARPCIKQGSQTLGGDPDTRINLRFIGFIFRDPAVVSGNEKFVDMDTLGYGGGIGTYTNMQYLHFANCTFYISGSNSSAGFVIPNMANSVSNSNEVHVRFDQCTLKRFQQVVQDDSGDPYSTVTLSHCIIDLNDSSDLIGTSLSTGAGANITNCAYDTSKYAGTPTVDLATYAPTYRDETYGTSEDLGLDRTDATNQTHYLAGGANLHDIGATWHPAIGFDYYWGENAAFTGLASLFFDAVSGTSWISDTNYENGTDKGPIAIQAGNTYALMDVFTQPAMDTGALVSPVWKVKVQNGRTAAIRGAFWAAIENTAPSSGSKEVIDSESGSDRKIQYRAALAGTWSSPTQLDASGGSVPAWTDIAREDWLTAVTFTADFHIQLRAIFTKVGD